MKQTTVNEFKDGLNLDLHPLVTPKTVLTDNINGTFITYNGNEFCLQNDRGNKYVTSLTPGYTPIGIKERNGILYIISVNENKTEIGTFPSPNYPESEADYNLEEEYDLINEYRPLHVLEDRRALTDINLGYTIETPVTIEIQDSYDGSVNLILVAKDCKPRIINSGFSVVSNNRYKFIKRRQSVETNIYTNLDKESELIRTSDIITNVELIDVKAGGQFKGGNYTFYIKFGDSDFNQTDVVAESGIVSVFNGNNGVPSTISGTLLDERTDKMIGLGIMGLNPIYSKIYIYYSREYSDTQGYRMTEYGMFNEPIDLKKDSTYGAYIQTTDPATGKPVYTQTMIQGQEIWLTGFEQTTPINPEILNIDYHTIDWARAEAQHSNMLFLGNVGQKETFELYTELDDLAKEIEVTVAQSTLQSVDTTYSFGSEYYDVHNIYDKVGYYPGEIYRFGIVYILKDGSKTPVFNMKGKNFQTNTEIEDGVFLMPDVDVIQENEIKPIYLTFNVPTITNDRILGWFIVRQKRIPNTICEGLSIAIDKTSNVPVIWDGKDWITQSFLDGLREAALVDKFKGKTDDWQDSRDVQLKYNNYDFAKYNFSNAEFQEWLNSKNYNYSNYWVSLNNAGDMYSADLSDITQTATIEVQLEQATRSIANKYKAAHPNEIVWDYDKVFILDTNTDAGAETARIALGSILAGQPFSVNWYREYEYTGLDELGIPISVPGNRYAAELKFIGKTMDYEGEIVTNDQNWNTSLYNSWVFAYRAHLNVSNLDRKILREWQCIDYWKEANALLSLDPCVNQGIAGILDGSKFDVRLEREVTVDPEQSVLYKTEVSNINTQFALNDTKCVFVPSNTGAKVVDGYEFSNIAGSGASTERFKYFTFPDGVFEKEGDYYRAEHFAELKRTIDNDNTSELSSEQEEWLYQLYRTNLNINLIRGLFTPYIGLANKRRIPIGVYSIKHKDLLADNDFLVRRQDQSEYYAVTEYKRVSDRSVNVYRGDCFTNTVTMRIIRNFIDDTAPVSDVIVDPNGWNDWVVRKDLNSTKLDIQDKSDKEGPVKYNEVNLSDVNTVDLGIWLTFKCLSSYNLGLRSLDTFHTEEMALMGTPRTFHPLNSVSTSTGYKTEESFLLNDGLSATVGRKRYNLFPKNAPYSKSEFSNRIMFSNVHVTDAFTNGYRTFQGMSYKDYDKQYGAITKLISLGQNIFVVMEHGLGLVPVNPKALMQTTTGEAIHIYGYGVLPDEMTIISQDYGSKYEHSVIRTPIGIYGVDVDAKKVWRFSDKQGFETISDMKIETYLKDYLSPLDIEMGLKDIRTHYNAKKGDIMFTFYTIDPDDRPAFNKKYFYINEEDITVYLNKERIVKCSTNMDDSEINLTFSDNLNCVYENKTIKIIGNEVGNGNIYVNDELKAMVTIEDSSEEQDTDYMVNLSRHDLALQTGQSYKLDAITNINNPMFIWESTNPSIVSVDQFGHVVGQVEIGTATINVTVEGYNVHDSCIINIQEDAVPVTSISLDKSKVYVSPDMLFDLHATINPDNASNKDVVWSISGNISTTESPNTFMAGSIGSGSVTVTTVDGNYSDTANVVISDNVPVTRVNITPRTMTLYQGQEGQVTATVSPETATNKNIIWSVPQGSKASVDQTGKVTAIRVGSSNVIAKSEDGNAQANALITVLQNPPSRIVLSKNNLSIKVGETGSVISTLHCEVDDWISIVRPNVDYKIANTSIAKVTSSRDQEVFIEGVSRGVTEIIFTAKDDPSVTASCEIVVTEGKLTLSTTYENAFPNETKKVTIIEKEGPISITQDNDNVLYEFENNAIYLTGNTVGTTIFTVTDGVTTVELEGETREIIPLNNLLFAKEIPEVIRLHVGEVFSLGYKYDPEDYTKEKYTVPFGIDNGDIVRGSRGDRPQYIWDPDLWGDSDTLTSWTALRPGTTAGHIEIWGGETEFRKIKDYVLNFEVIE